jgi:hypothetical protein
MFGKDFYDVIGELDSAGVSILAGSVLEVGSSRTFLQLTFNA